MSAPDGGERPYDCRMLVRFLQMQSRDARAALIAALLLVPLCAAPTATARWSAPARPSGCSAALPAAAAPSIVFPSADPTARSGPGALLWSAPRGCVAGAAAGEAAGAPGEAFGATLAADDLPGGGRVLAADAGGLAEVAAAAGTAVGQVLAVGRSQRAAATPTAGGRSATASGSSATASGSSATASGSSATASGSSATASRVAVGGSAGEGTGALMEGRTAGAFGAARPLGGPATPVAASSAYLGDVAIASPVRMRAGWAIAVRVQRHYSETPARARLVPVGASPVDAVATTMDYRAEVLLVWASGGTIYARELPPAGALGPLHVLGGLAAGSPDPELQALLSDDGHAIVTWRSQSAAPGGAPSTTIELSISGSALAFGAPRVLERFSDLGGFVPPAGSLRLLRLSSEAVMIAWTGVDAGRYVVRASPVSLRRGAWAPVVISGRGAVLADVAAGPDAEAFALWRTTPSFTNGAPGRVAGSDAWAIRAARGHYAGRGEVSFAAPELVAAPGPNGPAAVAVDPSSGRVLAAWVTRSGGEGEGRIEYALRAPTFVAAPARTISPTALACCMGLPYASIDSSAIRIGTPLAACLK